MAKRLLEQHGVDYEEINAASDPDLRQWLITTTGQRTVPQIFFGDEPIGGYQELSALQRNEGIRSRLGLD
jgi:glutaredoxin 3